MFLEEIEFYNISISIYTKMAQGFGIRKFCIYTQINVQEINTQYSITVYLCELI